MIPRDVETEKALITAYRNVFSSLNGKLVLMDILEDLGHFNSELNTTPEMVAMQSSAKMILKKLGVWDSRNIERIVDAYLTIPPALPMVVEKHDQEEY
jgi:hypothetical protein